MNRIHCLLMVDTCGLYLWPWPWDIYRPDLYTCMQHINWLWCTPVPSDMKIKGYGIKLIIMLRKQSFLLILVCDLNFVIRTCVIYATHHLVMVDTCAKFYVNQAIDMEVMLQQGSVHSIWSSVHLKLIYHTCADPEGGQGGPDPPPSLKDYKNIGFLSNTGLDPLKNHKATKLAFNIVPSSASQQNAIEMAFHWRADDDRL